MWSFELRELFYDCSGEPFYLPPVAFSEQFFPFGRQFVTVCPIIDTALGEVAFVNKRVKVRIEPAVVDFFLHVRFESSFDPETIGFVEFGDAIQNITLESGQLEHYPVAAYTGRCIIVANISTTAYI